MNKRRIGILCLLLIGSLFLNGCQLAMEEGDNGGNDRFCGFYITFESTLSSHIFNSEQASHIPIGKQKRMHKENPADQDSVIEDYYNGPSGQDFDGMDLARIQDFDLNDMAWDMGQGQGKIYAKEKPVLEDGISTISYVFEGIEGIPFFLASVAANDMSQGYWTTIMENNVFDAKVMINDEGGEIEGTIYLGLDIEGIFYLNPVYQTTDHKVYMLAGQGVHFSSGLGGSMSYDMSETYEILEDGKEKIVTKKAKITLDRMDPTTTIVFKEMDQSDKLVASTEIKRGAIPETIYLYETTEYIIVEEYSVRVDGQPITKRSILEMDDSSGSMTYECRFINEKGYAEGAVIQFER